MDQTLLECPVCMEIATAAMETSCCHQIYCEECVERLDNCALCRKSFTTSINHVIRRMIGLLLQECDFCKESFPRADMKDHKMYHCSKRPFECWVEGCNFEATIIKEDFLKHFVTAHEHYIINKNKLAESAYNNEFRDPIVTRYRGDVRARLGQTGKYYCGERLTSNHGSCCNGYCGTTNGCNCRKCMILDIKTRRLPRGYYVNREGAVARAGETGNYYCGRKVMDDDDYSCDGWCGPTNGPQCYACQLLEAEINNEYKDINWD